MTNKAFKKAQKDITASLLLQLCPTICNAIMNSILVRIRVVCVLHDKSFPFLCLIMISEVYHSFVFSAIYFLIA